MHYFIWENVFFLRLALSRESSDDESLNYEDNTDLESTIVKLRQLLADKSGEDSISSDDVQPPSLIHFINFDVSKENAETFKIQFQQSSIQDQQDESNSKIFSIKKKAFECLELSEKLNFKVSFFVYY